MFASAKSAPHEVDGVPIQAICCEQSDLPFEVFVGSDSRHRKGSYDSPYNNNFWFTHLCG